MTVGIDKLAIYTPRYALSHQVLAVARGIEVEKYHTGLGQQAMSIPAPGEDIVTMAANAAQAVLQQVDLSSIEMLLFATESGVDQSKAAGLFVHGLLGLPAKCRVLELKQACYSATGALQLALPYLREHPDKKILLIASDIARYGLNTPGESSQGAGAVALLLSAQPRLLAIEPFSGFVSADVMDFWRPNYSHEAFVDGKYSSKLYLQMLEAAWKEYHQQSGRDLLQHDYFCYHTPVPRLVEKAHQHLFKINQCADQETSQHQKALQAALTYGRVFGNSYSASLYVSLAALFDHLHQDLQSKRIGFYSYGSGCVAEYFSGVVQAGYNSVLNTAAHHDMLQQRIWLSYDEYEQFYQFQYDENGLDQLIPVYHTGQYRLTRMHQHKRLYEAAEPKTVAKPSGLQQRKLQKKDHAITIHVPGKLILSGEHAVVYGQPAIAMAVNRYVSATITKDTVPNVLFDLSDLSHRSHLTLDALRQVKQRIKQKYHRFIRGEYSIRDVLQKPFELAHYALGMISDSLNLSLPHGVKIHVQSDLPIGCGMGSSAATILSVMQAVSHYLQQPLSQEAIYQLALDAENMQHGHSSGLDLRVAMQGGCFYIHQQSLSPRQLPAVPMFIVNSGTPTSTTGQCVEKVAPFFKTGGMGAEFANVTNALDHGLQIQSVTAMSTAIRENHRLLTHIGVVPEPVQSFISEVETAGFAAKVCGAGSVSGEHAGAIWVMADDEAMLNQLSKRYGYSCTPLIGDRRGMHAA